MYNVPNGYSYHPHTYPSSMAGTEGTPGQLVNNLLSGIQKKATTVDFYHRLANMAPSQEERYYLMRMLEDEQRHWWDLTNVYTSLTDSHPVYQVESIPFHSYLDGLERAYEAELADYEQFRLCSMQAQHSVVYEVLVNTCRDEWEHARTLSELGAAEQSRMMAKDFGPSPYALNIDEATVNNDTFRTALWTGEHLQVTLMSINPGEDIGLEIHPNLDQFLRLEQGEGIVRMGDRQDHLTYEKKVKQDFAIMIPAGTWHNLVNTGDTPIKLYSIYAPPQHPRGTVHVTKADAVAAEKE
ncbi:cupin domain-containing protein [Rossellomorea sp. YZS02]|uniref:cupin domain-containing protein n=1 Tax=Rossellomorea sp. YZS02 TaxID=3097358 RepID=UPI002A14C12F|nr:cupin domain-containing protein [Rossellomorea sp. YZS02]MDX8343561.1 cupin domain-containing protein [Rossellomorea sp. YZS02]